MAVTSPDTALISAETFRTKYRTMDNSKDYLLEQIIAGVSAWISNRCGRRFTEATNTAELYSGDGSDRLYLNQWPVSAVASIYVDSLHKWAADTLLTVDDDSTSGDYRFETTEPGWGCVYRLYGGVWPAGVQNIKTTYTAGHAAASIPGQIELAALRMTAMIFDVGTGGHDAVAAVSYPLGAGSATIMGHKVPDDVIDMLIPFRRRLY